MKQIKNVKKEVEVKKEEKPKRKANAVELTVKEVSDVAGGKHRRCCKPKKSVPWGQ